MFPVTIIQHGSVKIESLCYLRRDRGHFPSLNIKNNCCIHKLTPTSNELQIKNLVIMYFTE